MIDLFCGVGTFSLPFATQVKRLGIIEFFEVSIESSKQNAKDNEDTNTCLFWKGITCLKTLSMTKRDIEIINAR